MSEQHPNIKYWLNHVAAHYLACTQVGHPYPKTEEEKAFREFYEGKVNQAKSDVIAAETGVSLDCSTCGHRETCSGGYYVWGNKRERCTRLEAYGAARDQLFNKASPPKVVDPNAPPVKPRVIRRRGRKS